MKKKYSISLTIGLCLFLGVENLLSAQKIHTTVAQNLPYYRTILIKNIEKNKVYDQLTNQDFAFTSVSVRVEQNADFTDARLNCFDEQTFALKTDDHQDDQESTKTSQLVMPIGVQQNASLYSANLTGNVYITFFYAKPMAELPIPNQNPISIQTGCTKPAVVPQSVWRNGLPAPWPNPVATHVFHCVVHHAASTNSDSIGLNTIRNIYLFHTTLPPAGNGWADVGYNFLIAPNGTIFEGRDGQGSTSTDSVRGAHFCGKNANTMGVCMMGDYMTTKPTNASLNALEKILTWKMFKENLWANDSSQHPIGSQAGYWLKRLVGHRDGCSTDCPGDSLYPMLPLLRAKITTNMYLCNGGIGFEELTKNRKTLTIYPNPAQTTIELLLNNRAIDLDSYRKIELIDVLGKAFFLERMNNYQPINVTHLGKGVYFIKLINQKDEMLVGKFIKQ